MPSRIIPKWRPSLALVLACTLAVVLCLPALGILALRFWVSPGYYPQGMTVILLIVLAVTGGLGWVLWRILLRPITTLAARADDIRTGQAAALDPLDHYGTVEMQHLGQAMRAMGQVLQSREMVLRSYADHVTHELKSPISAVKGAAELLSDSDLPAETRNRLLTHINAATARMDDLLNAQRMLARAHDPVAPGACLLSKTLPVQDDIAVRLSQDGVVPLPAPVLSVVLSHLISNAALHGATGVDVTWAEDHLTLSDNGPGISAGNRDRVFDPFFTTRRATGGTGMGLAIARRMLEAQGAQITLAPSDGAVFVIRW